MPSALSNERFISNAFIRYSGEACLLPTSCIIMQLVDEAFQRWLMEEEGVVDDITAVVVRFSYEDRLLQA